MDCAVDWMPQGDADWWSGDPEAALGQLDVLHSTALVCGGDVAAAAAAGGGGPQPQALPQGQPRGPRTGPFGCWEVLPVSQVTPDVLRTKHHCETNYHRFNSTCTATGPAQYAVIRSSPPQVAPSGLLPLPFALYTLVTQDGAPVERRRSHPFGLTRAVYDSADLPHSMAGERAVWAQVAGAGARWRQSAGEVHLLVARVSRERNGHGGNSLHR